MLSREENMATALIKIIMPDYDSKTSFTSVGTIIDKRISLTRKF